MPYTLIASVQVDDTVSAQLSIRSQTRRPPKLQRRDNGYARNGEWLGPPSRFKSLAREPRPLPAMMLTSDCYQYSTIDSHQRCGLRVIDGRFRSS